MDEASYPMYALSPSGSSILAWVAENPDVDWEKVNALIVKLEEDEQELVKQAVHVLKNEPPTGPCAAAATDIARSYLRWTEQNANSVRLRRSALSR